MVIKSEILDSDTTTTIEKMAEEMANKQVEAAPPDPLRPASYIKSVAYKKAIEELTCEFEETVLGVRELRKGLEILNSDTNPLNIEEIMQHFHQTTEVSDTLPKDFYHFTDGQIQLFEKVAQHWQAEKEFLKGQVVYELLCYLDPTNLDFQMGLGNAYYFQSKFEQALRHYSQVSYWCTEYPISHLYAAHCYKNLEQYALGITEAEQAQKISRTNSAFAEWQESAQDLIEELARKKI